MDIQTAIKNLGRRREELTKELAEVDSQLDQLKAANAIMQNMQQTPPSTPPSRKNPSKKSSASTAPPASDTPAKPQPLQDWIVAILRKDGGEMAPIEIFRDLTKEQYTGSVGSVQMALKPLMEKGFIERPNPGKYRIKKEAAVVDEPGQKRITTAAPTVAASAVWVPQLPTAISIIRKSRTPVHINQLGVRLNIKEPALSALLGDLVAKAAANDGIKRVDANTFIGID